MVKVNPIAQPDVAQVEDDSTLLLAGLNAEGVASDDSMTAKGAPDVDSEWRTKFEQQQAAISSIVTKNETDLRNLKSSLQRDQANAEKAWKAKEAQYQDQIRKLEYSSLPEDQRAQYVQELESQRTQDLQERLSQQETANQEIQALIAWNKFFIDQGVNPKDLTGDSVQEIMASGYAAIAKEKDTLRQKIAELEKNKTPTTPVKRAPSVTNSNVSNLPVGTKPTLLDLANKYAKGNVEKLFSLVETGQLSKDIFNEMLPK